MEEEDQHFGAYESSYENKDTANPDTQQGLKNFHWRYSQFRCFLFLRF